MATSYVESFKSKLDWAMPFQRTGAFPLDRSSMFSSYADALNYAKQDGSDTRALGGTSYVGQIVVVYGNNQEGTATEVAAYIITAVGESAALMKLAQTSATGDFAADIANLQSSLSALTTRVKALEDEEKVVDTNTTYTITTGVNTDGSIKITPSEGSAYEVQVRGWDTLVALATGRSKAFVYSNKTDPAYLLAAKKVDSFKVGDIIYFTDVNMADEWVSKVLTAADTDGYYYEFAALETEHPDLSGYLTSSDAALTYAKTTDLNTAKSELNASITELTTTVGTKADTSTVTTLSDKVDELETALGNIDVGEQITAKINDLDVTKVGGADGSYITSIEQQDGKIIATAATLPDYDTAAQEKADKALDDAKTYVDGKIGELSDTTVKDYVDAKETSLNEAILAKDTAMDSRVKVLETARTNLQSQITDNTDAISGLTTSNTQIASRVSTVESKVTALEGKVSTLETKVGGIEEGAQANRIETIKVGGTALNITEKAVDITSISTDLLTQGTSTLVLDCLNASLSNE